jgi:hypothetical protein
MKQIVPRVTALALLPLLSVGNATATAATSPNTLAGRCATFVRDSRPPANIRRIPKGPIVETLPSDTELRVDDDRSGWLHITASSAGWIYVSDTIVYCGSKRPASDLAVIGAVNAFGKRAQSEWLAADTLLRYDVFGAADGESAEGADAELGALMIVNPRLLISVLDQLPEAKRREFFRGLVLTGSADEASIHAFDKAVAAEPSHPASVTWRQLARQCGTDFSRLPHC